MNQNSRAYTALYNRLASLMPHGGASFADALAWCEDWIDREGNDADPRTAGDAIAAWRREHDATAEAERFA